MRCPFCKSVKDKVVDSRTNGNGALIRRRRECEGCRRRFTTYERVEKTPPLVVKKDLKRESFAREKVLSGITKACDKRKLPLARLEEIVDKIERVIYDKYEREVQVQVIGELVSEELKELDQVAYVRFASVYRHFEDISSFQNVLESLIEKKTPNVSNK